MSKATELAQYFQEHPLEPGEGQPMRPGLQVRSDTPSLKINDTLTVDGAIDHIGGEQPGIVLRDANGKAAAVLLSPERYAELAGCEVESECRFRAVEGRIEPDPQVLTELMIEQVDPQNEWKYGSRIWPTEQ